MNQFAIFRSDIINLTSMACVDITDRDTKGGQDVKFIGRHCVCTSNVYRLKFVDEDG